MIRRMAVGLVLLIAGGSFAACGAGTHSSPTAARSTDTAASPGVAHGADKSLSKAQALALARAVNLRASDVPGFTASSDEEKTHETGAEKRLEQEMLKCVGVSGLGPSLGGKSLAETRSKDFKLERGILNLSVHSEVSVARSAALASKDLTALRGSRVKACLSHYLNLFFKASVHPGTNVGPVSIQSGTPPAPGTSGSFGWRIASTFTVRRIPVPFYFDILSFAYGPAEVTLFSSGLPAPFPAKAQENLFSLLVARAKEQVLTPS